MSRRPSWQILALATVIMLCAAHAGRAAGVFIPVEPCRIVNTRDIPADGPKVGNRVTRSFTMQGKCGVPVGATAIAVNVTVTEQDVQGFLSIFPANLIFGVTAFNSNVNFPAGEFATDNGSIVPLATGTPDIKIYWDSLPSTAPGAHLAHVLIDVFGYFMDVDPATQVPVTCADGDFTTWDSGSSTWVCEAPPVLTGGDLTDVNEGTGIDVATPGGPAPTVSIETTYQLPQGCTSGQSPAFVGGVWVCQDPPASSGGDVTDVNEGTGIDVATSTGPAPTVSIETTYQLPQGCTSGQLSAFVGGVWVCQDPPVFTGGDVTDVNEGTGIDVTASTGPAPTVSLETTYQLPQGCTSGQVPAFVGGVWTCSGGAGTVTAISKSSANIYLVMSSTSSINPLGGGCAAFPCNTGTATASCLDNDDVGISGHCDMNPNTNSVILDQTMTNVDTTAAPASFTCRWRNDDTNPNNGKAVIVCLVVP